MSDAPPPPPPPPPQDPAPGQPPPGWYPTTPGMQGYWDGSRWTGDVAPLQTSSGDDNTLGMVAHLLGIFTSFLGPLVLYAVKKDESPYVRHHAAEALNFQLTIIIAMIASLFLILVIIGILLLIVVPITALVLEIVACVRAYQGEWYRYPFNIRFVR